MCKILNMNCSLKKYKTEVKTHYVGVNGEEFEIEKYSNWGGGEEKLGRKDLPMEGYPYRIKYKIDYTWKICRECNCKDKE